MGGPEPNDKIVGRRRSGSGGVERLVGVVIAVNVGGGVEVREAGEGGTVELRSATLEL